MSRSIVRRAYAKINIGLDVTGKRSDGYHLIDTVMQTVGLYDTLTFSPRDDGQIHITVNDPAVPADERNLVWKAVRLLEQAASITNSGAAASKAGSSDTAGNMPDKSAGWEHSFGLDIDLIKRIPSQAGMGGGSSDAAETLKAVRELYELDISDDELLALGAKLGADIPFCLTGGTVRCTGIGEVLKPLASAIHCPVLIVKPPEGVSTPLVYRKLDDMTFSHPDMDKTEAALRNGDPDALARVLGNVLENAAAKEVPVICDIKKKLCEKGAFAASMSGSGTSVFGLFADRAAAAAAENDLRKHFDKNYMILLTEIGGNDVNDI